MNIMPMEKTYMGLNLFLASLLKLFSPTCLKKALKKKKKYLKLERKKSLK